LRDSPASIAALNPKPAYCGHSKSQHNLEFSCAAVGYQPNTETLTSNMPAATVLSFFLLYLYIVDAASGAWKNIRSESLYFRCRSRKHRRAPSMKKRT